METLLIWIAALLILFVIAPLIIVLIALYWVKKTKQSSGGVDNSDTFACNYAFKVAKSPEEIHTLLARKSAYDTLDSAYDGAADVLTLFYYTQKTAYHVSIVEQGTYCLLYLQWIPNFSITILRPYDVNTFIIKKLDAEAYPYQA